MTNMRIAIAGVTGRMGKKLIQSLPHIEGIVLGAAFVRPGSIVTGIDVGQVVGEKILGIKLIDNLNTAINDFDVLIDFTNPAATLTYIDFCCKYKKSMVIGTTGFTEYEKKKIFLASENISIVLSPNFSVGINVVIKLLEKITTVMGNYADIEIIESHHRNKRDAPSGTALAMGEAIANIMHWDLNKKAIYNRGIHSGKRLANTIGFATIRAGDIIGEHTAIFADIGERIEITHKASSRITFAHGALKAAIWVNNKKPGIYSMQDVLALSTL
ncbi:4-hydroxy-tetrahydrodipicolinate reductase [Candidatus Ishikawella capsulata]|uniref:4-hydroxy-tetrahydrodipicolinate reductase n=1 Tax=Candidatus Ishikawaella capsulata Mpkobe TaxID=476281 RepID=C5WCW5_9ENTR|nr:4-hydroxy-tetrahydrodipicolinate reductase [Candidatus Ishikawaella capsulata]BAH83171.1 dihydrodipicolinate reductase [Candidatus Ishikawaella capsulata Mpkobe]